MLHAELGHRPIDVTIKTRLIGFCLNIIYGKESKLYKLLYDILFHQYCSGEYQHKRIHSIKELFLSVGLGRAAFCDCGTPWTFLLPFSETLVDLHVHDWHQKENLSSKGKKIS